MADIDALIATFPQQLQQNALRAAQQQLEMQNVQQNALKLQQQRAGMNALQNIYGDQNNIDPTTGLPRPRALGTLFQANPALGLDTIDALGRLQEYQSREAVSNLRTNEHYATLFDEKVAGPLTLRIKEQLPPNLPDDQKKQIIAGWQHELIDNAIKTNALPESVANRWYAIPPWNPSWAEQSDMLHKRNAEVASKWEPHEEIGTDGIVKQYYTNPWYPGHFFGPDRVSSYTPTGIAVPKGKSGDYFTATGVDEKGKKVSVDYLQGPAGFPVDPNDPTKRIELPKNPTIVSHSRTGAAQKYLSAPPEAEVKKPGGGYELRSVRQVQNPDGSITTTDARTGAVIPPDQLGEIRPPSAARPRSAATAFITKFMEEHPNASADEVSEAAAKFAVQQGGARAFLAGGRQGDSVRFIGNVVGSHLPTLETLSTALQNGDSRAINAISNTIKDQFGWSGKVDFDAAKTILAGEIVKAIQGYQGAEADRDRLLSVLKDSRSPEQLSNVIYVMRSLMAGQLAGLYRQAKVANVSDDQFMALLPPGAKGMLQKEMGIELKQGETTEPTRSIHLSGEQLKFPDGKRFRGSDGKIYIKQGNEAVLQ